MQRTGTQALTLLTRSLGIMLLLPACIFAIEPEERVSASVPLSEARRIQSLNGTWQVSLDSGKSWHPFEIPAPVEDQYDWDFDGKSTFRTEIKPIRLSPGERLFVRFSAVATKTQVYFQDQLVGEHLGGWTPFECELTEIARRDGGKATWSLRVEVDELVGHNTQGFLPIVIPHFGGIWQDVSLVTTSGNRFLDYRMLATTAASPAPDSPDSLLVRCAVNSPHTLNGRQLQLAIRRKGTPAFESLGSFALADLSQSDPAIPFGSENDRFTELTVPVRLDEWSIESPNCYELQLRLATAKGDLEDEIVIPVCNRSTASTADSIILNGKPLVLRGVLNWGYAPPSFAPSLDEAFMRKEIETARARGFNLMKFCLWIPPRRYLELCDEYGMLAWVEYPTWHPQLDQKHLPELQREFQEFFEYERNHPCVILRSLTCETGPGADINVIRDLYQRCKQAIPGAIVEDDSSWISWNRVSDFYDDHPYGNNHTWVKTLAGLKQYISEHDSKPLVLGEAIAADSFQLAGLHPFNPRTEQKFIARSADAKPLPSVSPHAPWAEAANEAWRQSISRQSTEMGLAARLEQLPADSRHYGLLMRKYQIETYRREVPKGGYVVSVIRDFPKAAMGLIDFAGQPKNGELDWKFQGDGMLLLQSQNDRRSFHAGQPVSLNVLLTWSGPAPTAAGKLRIELTDSAGGSLQLLQERPVPAVEFERPQQAELSLNFPAVNLPTRFVIKAEWTPTGIASVRNEWPVWVFPAIAANLPELVEMGLNGARPDWMVRWRSAADWSGLSNEDTVYATGFSAELLAHLKQGGRAIIVPNNTVNSLPTSQHWFLRGSPIGFQTDQSNWLVSAKLAAGGSIDLLNELQHFDLAGPVVPAIEHFRRDLLPLVLFWDNHDMAETRTHAGAFVLKVGAGKALVTTLQHGGATNAAGQWLLAQWLGSLKTSLPEALPDIAPRLERELNRQGMILHERNWKFQPDPSVQGEVAGWATAEFNDSDWGELTADRHWEGQGFKELDNWAWYRLRVTLPKDWTGPCFLNLTGADDYCNIFINGKKVGSCGDIANRKTAFEERASFDLSSHVKAGEEFVIAIAVYDWYGAGGLFKPMTLSSQPLDEAPPMLK